MNCTIRWRREIEGRARKHTSVAIPSFGYLGTTPFYGRKKRKEEKRGTIQMMSIVD